MSSYYFSRGEYLYVHNVGLFQIIENDGQGDCLFRAISQALYENSPRFHQAIRKSVVRHTSRHMWSRLGEKITRYWKLETIPITKFDSGQQGHWRRCFRIYGKCGKEKQGENKWKYRQLMSQGAFPGTSYELRAAADIYRFHVDFLVDLSNPRRSQRAADHHLRLYQFFSCRNNGCQVPVKEHYPHLYFLHRQNLQSRGGGHWELLLPRLLLLNTMPLHRKIYAVSSIGCRQLEEADLNNPGDILQRKMNEIGQDIDFLVSNGKIMPYEDPEWPPDDRDDFIGCVQHKYQKAKQKN